MIHQLLIKVFLLIAVLNLILLGICLGQDGLVYLGLFNLAVSIIFLFQHSSAIKAITPEGRRAFFSPSVFFLLAGIVALLAWHRVDPALWELLHMDSVRGAIGMGLFFYVGSYIVFGMNRQTHGWKAITKILFAFLFLGVLLRVGVLVRSTASSGIVDFFMNYNQNTNNEVVLDEEDDQDIIDEIDENTGNNGEEDSAEDSDMDADDNTDADADTQPAQEEPENMTYGSLIPRVISSYQLPESSEEYTFTNIPQSSDLYSAFNIARSRGMVGSNINPDREVRCENLMVVLGLAESWDVNSSLGTLDAYWQAAQERGYTQDCPVRSQVASTSFYSNNSQP